MNYRTLGRTEIKVSEIGLGGEWFNGKSQEEAKAIIDKAEEVGINYIDIFMPQAPTRDIIGNALKGRRKKFVIQGHLCTVFENEQYERTRDISKIKTSFEDLLTRLDTDYIDVGMIHYVDDEQDYKSVFETEVIEYAKELKVKGIIKHIGLSSHNPKIALKAVESGLIDVLLFSINPAYDLEHPDTDVYSLIDFKGLGESSWTVDPARQELYSACENLGIAITVMKALGAGSLLSEASSPFGVAMTVPQCIQYSLDRSGVKVVLIGCDKPEQVAEAVRYYEVSVKEREYSHIFTSNNKIVMTGRCMYCNHCQPCPSQIDIAAVTKYMDLALQQETVPDSVRQHYSLLKTNASDCIMCGNCEPNCPFGVKIRKNMAKAREIFK